MVNWKEMGIKRLLAKIDNTGRLLIPSQIRQDMGLSGGDEVIVAYNGKELRVYTRDQALRKLQSYARSLVPRGVSVVDELTAERRKEAAREVRD